MQVFIFLLMEGLPFNLWKKVTSTKCLKQNAIKWGLPAFHLLCIIWLCVPFCICSEWDPFQNVWPLVLRPYLPQNANISASSLTIYKYIIYSLDIWKNIIINSLREDSNSSENYTSLHYPLIFKAFYWL